VYSTVYTVYQRPKTHVDTTAFFSVSCALIKKENEIFLIYKKIQTGAVAKSFMRKGFLYEEMGKYLVIFEEDGSRI
jgi:hypothetical protein